MLRKDLKICVKKSIFLLGNSTNETKMSMLVLHSAIEFQNQTSLARIHFLKERTLEFALKFNYTQGLSSKVFFRYSILVLADLIFFAVLAVICGG